jgi:hypothetical protein
VDHDVTRPVAAGRALPSHPPEQVGEQRGQASPGQAFEALLYADWIALPKYGPNIRLGTPP